MALKKTNKVVQMNKEDYNKLAKEYLDISAQIKELEEKKKELADKFKEQAEKAGVKDDKGSYYLDVEGHILGKVAKKSVSLNQEAGIKLLKEKKLNKCIQKVVTEVIDEKALEQAVMNEEITKEELEGITNTKVSYSVSVVKKETESEMPEITQSYVAKKKK